MDAQFSRGNAAQGPALVAATHVSKHVGGLIDVWEGSHDLSFAAQPMGTDSMRRSGSYGSNGSQPVSPTASAEAPSHEARQSDTTHLLAATPPAYEQKSSPMWITGWDKATVWSYVETILWSTAWVAANVFLTMYNKWGFQRAYSVPVFLTCSHCFASFFIAAFRSLFVKRTPNRVPLRDVWKQCVLYAIFNAIFLSCNNWAIMRLHPATVEVLKTFQPVVQVIIAMGVEGYMIDGPKIGTLALLTGFSVLTTYNPTHFDLQGFSMVFVALIAMALRQSYTGLIFKKGLKAWDTILYTQGISAIFLVPPTLFLETSKIVALAQSPDANVFWYWIIGGSATAVFYLFTSFGLQRITDSIYMTIAGKIKNVVIIIVSSVFIHIQFESFQIVGMIGTLFAAALYTYLTIEGAKKDTKKLAATSGGNGSERTAGREGDAIGGGAKALLHDLGKATLPVHGRSAKSLGLRAAGERISPLRGKGVGEGEPLRGGGGQQADSRV